MDRKKENLFTNYLLHTKKEDFADKLKEVFCSEDSIDIRILIELLENWKPEPLMSIPFRKRKGKNGIYAAMKKYFDRNIGSANSIFDFRVKFVSSQNNPNENEDNQLPLKKEIKYIYHNQKKPIEDKIKFCLKEIE